MLILISFYNFLGSSKRVGHYLLNELYKKSIDQKILFKIMYTKLKKMQKIDFEKDVQSFKE